MNLGYIFNLILYAIQKHIILSFCLEAVLTDISIIESFCCRYCLSKSDQSLVFLLSVDRHFRKSLIINFLAGFFMGVTNLLCLSWYFKFNTSRKQSQLVYVKQPDDVILCLVKKKKSVNCDLFVAGFYCL